MDKANEPYRLQGRPQISQEELNRVARINQRMARAWKRYE